MNVDQLESYLAQQRKDFDSIPINGEFFGPFGLTQVFVVTEGGLADPVIFYDLPSSAYVIMQDPEGRGG